MLDYSATLSFFHEVMGLAPGFVFLTVHADCVACPKQFSLPVLRQYKQSLCDDSVFILLKPACRRFSVRSARFWPALGSRTWTNVFLHGQAVVVCFFFNFQSSSRPPLPSLLENNEKKTCHVYRNCLLLQALLLQWFACRLQTMRARLCFLVVIYGRNYVSEPLFFLVKVNSSVHCTRRF